MDFPTGYIEGFSPAITLLHQEIFNLSSSDLPVLIVGETGVGKEHYGRLVHMWSKRREAPFVAVNCAAIPAELLEVEMFGIGRGVATGVTERAGYFQLAKGGTLFLDEIGELSFALQAKMLRALEEREIHRVGGTAVEIDVRFVAATNNELRQAAREGRFREDLYYRLAGAEVYIPPLRSRDEDFLLLMRHFMDTAAREAGKSIQGITLKAVELLRSYSWPGNVRELQHEIRRLVYLCPAGAIIDDTMLPQRIISEDHIVASTSPPEIRPASQRFPSLTMSDHVDELEGRLIRLALTQTRGNQTRAAKLLGISRNGLATKMRRLGIMNNSHPWNYFAE